jgi:hypothetical protein
MTDNSGSPAMASTAPIGVDDSVPAPVNVGKGDLPSPAPANPMGRIRLSTLSDVAKEVKKLYRESRNGSLPVEKATKLAYLLNMLAQVLTASDLENRLAELERKRG